ncbi:hypothetical protein V6N11_033129 [Hibiscus sabdariffa]
MTMSGSFYVDPVGIAGGLALWLSNEANISVLNFGKSFIDIKVSINGEEKWNNNSEKWCLIGDSNIAERPEEKLGGLPFDASSAKWYYDFTYASCLLKISSKGGTFTWSNQRREVEAILENWIKF